MALGEGIRKAIPWIEPVLDYFDWKKQVVAVVAALALAGWSFVKGLPWPVIITVGFAVLVMTAYALAFPAFLKLVNVGVEPKPKPEIWKTKKQYSLSQAAILLADTINFSNPDAQAWFFQLCDAINDGEMKRIQTPQDDQN